ncbi:MAG: hypothetical protein AB7W59_00035 [Acidimicrobiia bacterium]
MSWLKRAWEWIKKHAVASALGIGAILGTLAFLLARRGSGMPIGDVLKLRREAQEIARKEARAEELVKAADGRGAEAEALRAEVAESKRRVLEIQHGPVVQEMDDEAVADLFRRSGL